MHFGNEKYNMQNKILSNNLFIFKEVEWNFSRKKNKKVGLTTENLGSAKNQQANEIEPMPGWCGWVPRVQLMSDLT